MKAHSGQLVSILEIVNKALADLGESSHRKEQFILWSVDYFRKLKMDMAREIRTVSLSMTAWKSVILPDDCVDWYLIGIRNGQDLMAFTKKSILARDCSCDEDEPTTADYASRTDVLGEGINFFNYTEFGEDPGKLYGLLVKDNGLGYFAPNPNPRVNEIQLSTHVPAGTPIILMYLATLFDPTVDSVVHPYCEDMIRKGIHYENLKHRRRSGNRNITRDMILDAKQELDDEICLVAERRWDLSEDDIIEAARAGIQLGLKK